MSVTFARRLPPLLALMAAFAAGAAAAAPPGASEAVRTGPPVASVMIDGRVWSCTDSACAAHASVTADSQPAPRECARAAAVLGPFASYSSGARVLTGEELARCNRRAKAPAPLLAAR